MQKGKQFKQALPMKYYQSGKQCYHEYQSDYDDYIDDVDMGDLYHREARPENNRIRDRRTSYQEPQHIYHQNQDSNKQQSYRHKKPQKHYKQDQRSSNGTSKYSLQHNMHNARHSHDTSHLLYTHNAHHPTNNNHNFHNFHKTHDNFHKTHDNFQRKHAQPTPYNNNNNNNNNNENNGVTQRLNNIEIIMGVQNNNLKDHNAYLMKIVHKLQKNQCKLKKMLEKVTDENVELMRENQELRERYEETKAFMANNICKIQRMMENQGQNHYSSDTSTSFHQIQPTLPTQQSPQKVPTSSQITSHFVNHSIPQLNPQINQFQQQHRKMQQLNDLFDALMFEYKKTKDPSLRRQCIEIVKEIKKNSDYINKNSNKNIGYKNSYKNISINQHQKQKYRDNNNQNCHLYGRKESNKKFIL